MRITFLYTIIFNTYCMKLYDGTNDFNKPRKWVNMPRKYDHPDEMHNLEEVFRTSKWWRWHEDAMNPYKNEYTLKDAENDVKTTLLMWNKEIVRDEKGYDEIHPTKHDLKVFAQLLYTQFNRSPSRMRESNVLNKKMDREYPSTLMNAYLYSLDNDIFTREEKDILNKLWDAWRFQRANDLQTQKSNLKFAEILTRKYAPQIEIIVKKYQNDRANKLKGHKITAPKSHKNGIERLENSVRRMF